MSLISNAFAETASTSSPMSNLTSFLPLALMFVVLYFVMIRPQMKRQKEHRNMLAAITKGDEVITSGGILGRVVKVGENFVNVEITENVEINVQKSAITALLPKGTIKAL
ncbi:preprotein translocase subunit YajC [Candidatus Pandoraea novymonadis]|uniref:Sec translocon accessory complex subunit YajC n=1 Tax=Candidatus Pandoraea novymonadis TaxID=1808959 RepID=A0ABX5FDP8_9BURK|nr:preprotein translocase subunit YajC [Candidatus Pandoraea novymonadis]PSB91864.1 hypothetical protein BZL35_00081 [Candidatus Pandoraea novymonadis]